MKRTYLRILIPALLALGLAVPAAAYRHGGGGGFHGGGFGGFPGGGFHAGGFGGYGGFRGGFSPPAFNRTPSFSMPRAPMGMGYGFHPNTSTNFARPNTVTGFNRGFNPAGNLGNVNRFNTAGNLNQFGNVNNFNRVNNLNNVNRVGNLNVANNAGWGWHNPYSGYHQGWAHGYWNGHYPGYWGGYPGYWGWGTGGLGWGLGLGLGYGLSSWLWGPMLYNWGYSPYYNPYYGGYGNTLVAQQPIVYDYSQPIDGQSEPPAENVANQANATFQTARDAFRNGDYPQTLNLVDQALRQTPNDPTLHEFRALALFALKRYDEAAAVLYSVLSIGPGWDWTTMIGLYGDPEAYTQQLRALEDYCRQNPQSPAARFVLAYHYLTEGYADEAMSQLKQVAMLQPKDRLAAQLLQQLESASKQASAGTETAQNQAAPAPASPGESLGTVVAGKEGKLDRSWSAQPAPDTAITLSFPETGRFAWSVSRQSKEQRFTGKDTYENGILTLVQDQNNNNVMVGHVRWIDEDHFNFKVLGGGPDDPGLTFSKAP
jgi:tetratricopeptide (TPR) repeat protein